MQQFDRFAARLLLLAVIADHAVEMAGLEGAAREPALGFGDEFAQANIGRIRLPPPRTAWRMASSIGWAMEDSAGKSLFRCVSTCPRRVSNSSIVGVGNVEVFKFAVAIKLLHLELCLLQFVLT